MLFPMMAQATNSGSIQLWAYFYFSMALPFLPIILLIGILIFRKNKKALITLLTLLSLCLLLIITNLPRNIYVVESIFNLCEPMTEEVLQTSCYYNKARKKNDPELCKKIRNITMKDSCYYSLALENANSELCEKISPKPLSYDAGNLPQRQECFFKTLYKNFDSSYCFNNFKNKDEAAVCVQFLAFISHSAGTRRMNLCSLDKKLPCSSELSKNCLELIDGQSDYCLICAPDKYKDQKIASASSYTNYLKMEDCAKYFYTEDTLK